jgi:hypothetical protein
MRAAVFTSARGSLSWPGLSEQFCTVRCSARSYDPEIRCCVGLHECGGEADAWYRLLSRWGRRLAGSSKISDSRRSSGVSQLRATFAADVTDVAIGIDRRQSVRWVDEILAGSILSPYGRNESSVTI